MTNEGHHMMKNINVKCAVAGLSAVLSLCITIITIIITINLDVKGAVPRLSGLTRGVRPALFKGVTEQLQEYFFP